MGVDQQGTSLVGVLCSLALLALLITLAVDALQPTIDRRGAEACAAQLAGELRRAAVEAVSSARSRGLVFPESGADEPLRWAEDGDGDGIRRSDLAAGVDHSSGSRWLAATVDRCRIGRPPGVALRELPPSTLPLDRAAPSVRFGSSRIASFTPEGTATAGSLFVSAGGDGVCAVVVNGASARSRVFCWDPLLQAWRAR